MTAFSLRLSNARQRRQPAPRARRPTRPGRALARQPDPRRSPTASTSRPGSASRCATCSSATSAPTSTTSTRATKRGRFWERIDQIPDARPVGGPPAPEARADDLRPQAGCATSSPATARRRASSRSSRTSLDPDDPDDRLRPPLRDLQAGRPAVHATSTGSRGCSATRSGRSRSSSPARPTRPTGPARASSRRSSRGRARRSSAAASSSSRTTTCGSPASWSRASTSGSTTRAGRSRRRARAA